MEIAQVSCKHMAAPRADLLPVHASLEEVSRPVCRLGLYGAADAADGAADGSVGLPQGSRSRQGKMEKSLLSFATAYPTWEPGSHAKQLLLAVAEQSPQHLGPHFPYTAHASEFHPALGLAPGGLHSVPNFVSSSSPG